MGQRITVVDAFTHAAFAGNPAAVCVLTAPTTEAWMQSVAREMKHSETAFCIRLKDGTFELRWFTPEREVRLCGHATLAAAHVLWEEGWLEHRRTAHFSTLSGELTAAPLGRVIELDFPSHPPSEVEAPAGLVDALGVTPSWIGRDLDDYVVLLADEAAVIDCDPDFGALRAVETRGVIITAPAAGDQVDFVSRFFAPRFGVDEDPVTGSAHCCLTPFWASRLDKSVLTARQLSRRGGELEVEHAGDRVKLRGTCVTTLRGNLTESAPSDSSWSRH
ncbi:MAG: PhzF family phenazine biosynthesis protein [Myxococcales bacterium]|jgi:PhzF family phenazine biosynthesis protein|nr:PhzF family phenazine biosynthesis protein [Myxococcales bacterium]